MSVIVHKPQLVLGARVLSFRCKPVPLYGRLVILRNSVALVIHQAQVELRRHVPLFRGKRVPPDGLLEVLLVFFINLVFNIIVLFSYVFFPFEREGASRGRDTHGGQFLGQL